MRPGNMDDTISEATSPHTASEMECWSMFNQCHLQHQTNQRMTQSQRIQHRFLQGDSSRQPRSRGPRARLSEHERRERIKLNNVNYRLRKKDKVNDMIAWNQYLQGENKRLKEENRLLNLKNTDLEEHIRTGGLRGKEQIPAEVPQREDSYISQPASQVDQRMIYVQDRNETESNNDDRVYRNHRFMDEGAADHEIDGLGMNELLTLISADNEITTNRTLAVNEPVIEHPESFQSGQCPAEVARIKLQSFLMELDADVESNVGLLDFEGLEEEKRSIGRFSFPSGLIPTLERIRNVHGDVSQKCLISPVISGTIYVLFCATIREMEHLQLEHVTEEIMRKWRDVIKDALRLRFDVKFAMEHLKEIACAYFGLPGHRLLRDINAEISTLEAEVNVLKKKHDKIYEESKMSIEAADKFIGVPVSTGLFSQSSSNTNMHC